MNTLKDCMQDWLAKYRTNEGAISLLRTFCGVSRITIARWTEGIVPVGMGAIKLSEFMRLFGYALPEPDTQFGTIRQAVAYDLIDVASLSVALGISPESVCAILRGRRKPSPKGERTLRRKASEIRALVAGRESQWLESVNAIRGEPTGEKVTESTPASAMDSGRLVASLVSMFNTISNLAMAGIDPSKLTDDDKMHIVFTNVQLYKKLGITEDTIERVRRKQEQFSGDLGQFAKILNLKEA